MSEFEISKYCRENGYYLEDVKAWRDSCITANELQKEDSKELRLELNLEKKKAKTLEKEIRIKIIIYATAFLTTMVLQNIKNIFCNTYFIVIRN